MTVMKWVIADLNQTMSVKEQRVDGSSTLSKNVVRCTLVAGKPVLGRNITHLSYYFQYSRSLFHTTIIVYNKYDNKLLGEKFLLSPNKLNPWFVTGFVDTYQDYKNKSGGHYKLTACLTLVIWGTNLPSSVSGKTLTKQIREMFSFPSYQRSVIVGLLLSDGWLIFSNYRNKNARLGFKQSLSHFYYIWFVFSILSIYCSSYPQLITGVRAGNWFFGLIFFTRALPCFTELYPIFLSK